MEILVILPAYNEEEALPPLFDSLAKEREAHLPEMRVFVVDDGSSDSTADVVRAHAKQYSWLNLVQHERNQGLSAALQTGFKTTLSESGPQAVIVTLDADNTQPPDRIPGMVELIALDQADVVIASRFQPGAEVYGVPPMRRVYSRVMSLLFQGIFAIRGVRDYSCGFRAYRASVLQQAYDTYGEKFITEQGFSCMVEVLFQLDHLPNVRFGEVPFKLHYDLKPTETKMRVFNTITNTLRVAFKHRFRKRSNG
jgi:dolichol-phosphate mannosyltransferase